LSRKKRISSILKIATQTCRSTAKSTKSYFVRPMKPTSAREFRSVHIDVENVEDIPFKWQMVFNWYSVDRFENGKIVHFAFQVGGNASEIVPIVIGEDGIKSLKDSVSEYIKHFEEIRDLPKNESRPSGRVFTPMYSNNVRLALGLDSAEVTFYTILTHDIARLSKNINSKGIRVKAYPLALMHSSIQIHKNLVLDLLS